MSWQRRLFEVLVCLRAPITNYSSIQVPLEIVCCLRLFCLFRGVLCLFLFSCSSIVSSCFNSLANQNEKYGAFLFVAEHIGLASASTIFSVSSGAVKPALYSLIASPIKALKKVAKKT